MDVGLVVLAAFSGRSYERLTAACDGGVSDRVQPGENLGANNYMFIQCTGASVDRSCASYS